MHQRINHRGDIIQVRKDERDASQYGSQSRNEITLEIYLRGTRPHSEKNT